MATGDQDIISLGLDVTSFNDAKKSTLKEFIVLFDTLAKYDGKIFNPVAGDGLAKLNTSIAESNRLLDTISIKMSNLNTNITGVSKNSIDASRSLSNSADAANKDAKAKEADAKVTKLLTNELQILKQALKETEIAYANSVLGQKRTGVAGFDANQNSKKILADYTAQATLINRIEKDLAKAGGGASNLGVGLTHALGYLRNIAYILPGIGLAGIFNLAFDAIGECVQALGLFVNKEAEQVKITTGVNNALSEQIKIYDNLTKAVKEFYDTYKNQILVPGSVEERLGIGNLNPTSVSLQTKLNKDSARGLEQGTLLKEQLDIALKNFQDTEKTIQGMFHVTGKADRNIELNLKNIQNRAQDALDILSKADRDFERYSLIEAKGGQPQFSSSQPAISKSEAENLKNLAKSQRDLAEASYKEATNILKGYIDNKNQLQKVEQEIEKFNSDQERKLLVERTKEDISLDLEKQKAILDNDKKFHDARHSAILKEYQDNVKISEINRISVTGTKDNPNLSATTAEIQIAINKQNDDVVKAQIKRDKDIEKNDVEFYQRKLKALTEINKDEIEQDVLANEKIFVNEKHSLDKRLIAYESYVIGRQKIKDLEYAMDIQKSAARSGGLTSLTSEEKDAIESHRIQQQYSIQADAERQIYNIIHSYLDQQLKDVVDKNSEERSINKEAYAKELSDNNERFKKNIFLYQSFKREKERIDKKYGVILSIEDELKRDEESIHRLSDLYKDLSDQKAESDKQVKLKGTAFGIDVETGANAIESERAYNEELGRNNALADAIKKAQDEINEATEKGENDKVRQAKARYEQLIQFEKEYAANKRAIEEGLWKLGENLINSEVENKIRAIEDIMRTRDEQYSLEEKAIQDSSLNAKDKAALDIQINQQKIEADKAAMLEERRLKHDAAVKDRELNVAHVLWNTIESVSAALKIAPPAGEILAAQRAVLGGIEVAQIMAVDIPSYKHGTKGHKGGLARYAEDGWEVIKEPGKKPYLVTEETISELPEGTQVIPLNKEHPEFDVVKYDDSWAQTKFLAKQIKNSNREIKNIFNPTIIINMGFENRKKEILGN